MVDAKRWPCEAFGCVQCVAVSVDFVWQTYTYHYPLALRNLIVSSDEKHYHFDEIRVPSSLHSRHATPLLDGALDTTGLPVIQGNCGSTMNRVRPHSTNFISPS